MDANLRGDRKKMKIAYVLGRFPSVSETFVAREIVAHIESGVNVEIFSLFESNTDVIHDFIKSNKLVEKTHYFRYRYLLKLTHREKFQFILNILKLPFLRPNLGVHGWRTGMIVSYFASMIQSRNFDLIHSHFSFFLACTVSRLCGKPMTFTIHSAPLSFNNDYMSKIKFMLKKVAGVITISKIAKIRLLNIFSEIPERKIQVIHCGIDTDFYFGGDCRKSSEKDTIRLVTVSGFGPTKGLVYLIRAVKILEQRGIKSKSVIVGGCPFSLHKEEREKVEREIENLSLKEKVKLCGELVNEEIRDILKEADIFVLPCCVDERGAVDGIPVALMEAMAMEVPVVSTFVGGIHELVENEVNGILVPEKNPEAIAFAIEDLAKNPEKRRMLGKAGREKIVAEFEFRKNSLKMRRALAEWCIENL